MENDKKGKMSARPPVSKGAEDFILSATTNIIQDPIEKGRVKKNYPWEEPHVRSDVIKSFNMRLPEDFYLKLKFLLLYL